MRNFGHGSVFTLIFQRESCCCGSDAPEVVKGLLGSGSGDGPLALVLDAGLRTSGLCGSARSDWLALSLTLPLAPVWEESAGVGVLMGRWSRKTKTVSIRIQRAHIRVSIFKYILEVHHRRLRSGRLGNTT